MDIEPKIGNTALFGIRPVVITNFYTNDEGATRVEVSDDMINKSNPFWLNLSKLGSITIHSGFPYVDGKIYPDTTKHFSFHRKVIK